MLDAYIIEEIKKREEARRIRDDADRPRLHIEIPGWPRPDTDVERPEDPTTEDHHEDDEPAPDVIHIDL